MINIDKAIIARLNKQGREFEILISNQQVIVRSLGVSGILNKAKERYSI